MVAELMAHAGFEWLMIETEHNAVDWADVQQMMMAINATSAVPMVRLPSGDATYVQRALDSGAMGVMVPMIRTADDARRVVAATRYPPHGRRGFGGLRASSYTLRNAEYFQYANDQILVVLIIETREAVENIDAIAAEPGVDVLMLGTFDLYLSLGLDPFRQPLPEGEIAVERVLDAGRRFQRVVGGAYGSAADLRQRREQGFRMLASWPTRPRASWPIFTDGNSRTFRDSTHRGRPWHCSGGWMNNESWSPAPARALDEGLPRSSASVAPMSCSTIHIAAIPSSRQRRRFVRLVAVPP
jgi:2-keto-3-deoxy-L-rhamnonate aldolase RhmA